MSDRFRILMLEDQPADAELAAHALRRGGVSFNLTRVETKTEFLCELEHRPPDLILSDHALPDFDGFTALDLTKQKRPDIPFIFFTGSLGEENAIRTLRHGATDYVLKHRLGDLVPAVHRAVREHQERVMRMQAEEDLRELTAELEDRVAERTAQLEAAYKELESFSYSVSHDLRAPLRHIDGFADILLNIAAKKLDANERGYLKTISDAAKQMGRLIDDLLLFSRMSRAELSKTTVDMNHLVKEIKKQLVHDIVAREIEWHIHKLPAANGDPNLLRQVWANLIGNALKYTRPRKMARIEIGSSTSDGEQIYFVRDNGVGFEMKYADKLFGVFARLHRATEFEGTGIGLANVRRIVYRHGGRTWAEGELDKGATFYFSLPKNLPPTETEET